MLLCGYVFKKIKLADSYIRIALNIRLNINALIQLNTTSWAFATRHMRRRVNHNIATINSFDARDCYFDTLKLRRASRAIGNVLKFRVSDPIVINGQTVVAQGAPAEGEITNLKRLTERFHLESAPSERSGTDLNEPQDEDTQRHAA